MSDVLSISIDAIPSDFYIDRVVNFGSLFPNITAVKVKGSPAVILMNLGAKKFIDVTKLEGSKSLLKRENIHRSSNWF